MRVMSFSVEVAVDSSRGYSLDSRLRNPRLGKWRLTVDESGSIGDLVE